MSSKVLSCLLVACSLSLVTTASAAPAGLAYALLGTDGSNGGHVFGIVNLQSGAFTPIGDTGTLLSDLSAAPDGTLYAATPNSFNPGGGEYFRINPANGALTQVANTSVGFLSGTTSGFYGYATNPTTGRLDLYTVNPATGQGSLVGDTGLSVVGVGDVDGGVSNGASGLYLTLEQSPGVNSQLFSVNTATGAATLVGSAGINGLTGMVYQSGTLWVGRDSEKPLQIYTIDPATAQTTFVANITGAPINAAGIWGLAPAAVPEPSTFSMLTVGLLGLIEVLRRRRATP